VSIVPAGSDPVVIVVPGEPKGKGRPRFSRFGHAYTPEATRIYEASVAYCAKRAMAGRAWVLDPVCMSVDAFFGIRPSWTKQKKADALCGALRPGKPDWDNVGKLASDALNGIAYRDDSQVVECCVRKFYSNTPMLRIMVMPAPVRNQGELWQPFMDGTSLPSKS
jgi:Holliday junction resolvase RusA-like endonuclease